jgi:PGAP1-like protein
MLPLWVVIVFGSILLSMVGGLQTPLGNNGIGNPWDFLGKNIWGKSSSWSGKTPVSIVVCPAQFCVPIDYDILFDNLRQSLGENCLGTCRVAPLPRNEWIKVAKSLPTREYLDGTLQNYKTLSWYFDAIEVALNEILEEQGPNANICIIGHSIGGWVARAFLGGLSQSTSPTVEWAQRRVTSLVTLGTPHISPDGALVDQTRGLLREVEATPECSASSLTQRGISVICVGSASLTGDFFTTNLEEFVAATSYLPLLGRLDNSIRGDGIIPTELAFLESPARSVLLDVCPETGDMIRHAHVFPTPWNLWDGSAPSISLPFTWYGSSSVIGTWAQFIR